VDGRKSKSGRKVGRMCMGVVKSLPYVTFVQAKLSAVLPTSL
jgi:hypothetical protein